MDLKTVVTKGLKRGYELIIKTSELDKKVDEKLELERSNFQMKGFRRGQTPLHLIKKMYGKSTLGEVLEQTIDAEVKNHFTTSGDRPALQPKIEIKNKDWQTSEKLIISIEYEKIPKIPEVNFSSIKIEKLIAKIDKTAIEKALVELSKSAKDFKKKKNSAKASQGDQIIIDFVGTIDSKPFDGGTAEDYPLVLGSGSFIPGFEKQLIGSKVSDFVEVAVKFPVNYGSKDLSGKDAIFSCTIKAINQEVPAIVNDAMAQKFGSKDLKDLTAQVRERLGQEYNTVSRNILKRKLMDALHKTVKFDLPPSLVESEAKQIAEQLRTENKNVTEEQLKKAAKVSTENTKIAKRRVLLGLLFAEIGRLNNINVSATEFQEAIKSQSQQYPGKEQEFFKFVESNSNAQEQIRAPIFEDKVFDYILELVVINEKAVTVSQLQKELDK